MASRDEAVRATRRPVHTRPAWDRAAAGYDRLASAVTGRYADAAIAAGGVTPGQSALDVACGTGVITLGCARRGLDVHAVDHSPAMLEHLRQHAAARQLAHRITTTVMDGQDLHVPPASFDVAFNAFGLMFFADPARGLSEMHRVLKPGGKAVVTTWAAPSRVPHAALLHAAVASTLPDVIGPANEPPAVFSLSDPRQVQVGLEAAGFVEVRVVAVTRVIVVRSAERLWQWTRQAVPLFAGIPDDAAATIQRTATRLTRQRFGDHPVRMPQQALIGRGTRCAR